MVLSTVTRVGLDFVLVAVLAAFAVVAVVTLHGHAPTPVTAVKAEPPKALDWADQVIQFRAHNRRVQKAMMVPAYDPMADLRARREGSARMFGPSSREVKELDAEIKRWEPVLGRIRAIKREAASKLEQKPEDPLFRQPW